MLRRGPLPLSSSSALNTLIVRSGCLVKNQCDLCYDGSLCCFGPLAQHVSRFTCGDPPGRTATVTPLQQKLLRCSLSPATHSRSLSSLRSQTFFVGSLCDQNGGGSLSTLPKLFPCRTRLGFQALRCRKCNSLRISAGCLRQMKKTSLMVRKVGVSRLDIGQNVALQTKELCL